VRTTCVDRDVVQAVVCCITMLTECGGRQSGGRCGCRVARCRARVRLHADHGGSFQYVAPSLCLAVWHSVWTELDYRQSDWRPGCAGPG
jgi:hypothetical protein